MEVTHAMTGTVRRHHGWTGSSCHGDSAFYPDLNRRAPEGCTCERARMTA